MDPNIALNPTQAEIEAAVRAVNKFGVLVRALRPPARARAACVASHAAARGAAQLSIKVKFGVKAKHARARLATALIAARIARKAISGRATGGLKETSSPRDGPRRPSLERQVAADASGLAAAAAAGASAAIVTTTVVGASQMTVPCMRRLSRPETPAAHDASPLDKLDESLVRSVETRVAAPVSGGASMSPAAAAAAVYGSSVRVSSGDTLGVDVVGVGPADLRGRRTFSAAGARAMGSLGGGSPMALDTERAGVGLPAGAYASTAAAAAGSSTRTTGDALDDLASGVR